MEYEHLSDLELLAQLIGKREANRLYKGSLARVFFPGHLAVAPHRRLAAAHLLVRRLLLEEVQRGPALCDPTTVRSYLRATFAGIDRECFTVLLLDAQHRVIGSEVAAQGTIDAATVYPREIVKLALRYSAAATILAHNHPSGVAEPSLADRALTDRLKQALSLVDIRVLDHFVVGGATVVSFAERGWL